MSEHCDNFILCLSPSSLEIIASNKIYIPSLLEGCRPTEARAKGGQCGKRKGEQTGPARLVSAPLGSTAGPRRVGFPEGLHGRASQKRPLRERKGIDSGLSPIIYLTVVKTGFTGC